MREKPEVFRKYDIRGEAPAEIDTELVFQLGKALGDYWNSGEIAVGRDVRKSSPAFYHAMISGLLSQGCTVTALGLATTDMAAFHAQKNFDGAVQITASHMPPDFGGFKPLNSQGRILSNDEMVEMKKIYMREEASEESCGEFKEEKDAVKSYREGLVNRYNEIFSKDLSGLKIVVDCSNSVGSLAAPDALDDLGAETVLINEDFGSASAHSPEPSEASSEELGQKVLEEDADLGAIFDGDADRVMFVDEKGEFIDGDIPLALLSRKYLDNSEKIVCSVNTGKVVEEMVEAKEGEINYVPVGAVFTALDCIEEDITFGGQPNGHLMDKDFVPYDSGSLFALLVPGLMAEESKSFSQLVEGLERYEKEKFNFETSGKNELMREIREVAKNRGLLEQEKFNALKLDFGDFTVLLRPSGSEDLVRVTLEGKALREKDLDKVKEFLEGFE